MAHAADLDRAVPDVGVRAGAWVTACAFDRVVADDGVHALELMGEHGVFPDAQSS